MVDDESREKSSPSISNGRWDQLEYWNHEYERITWTFIVTTFPAISGRQPKSIAIPLKTALNTPSLSQQEKLLQKTTPDPSIDFKKLFLYIFDQLQI